MINQTSYEIFGYPLTVSSQNVVFLMGDALKKLHKRIIKDPGNIETWHKLYELEIANIAKQFTSDWEEWADYDLAKSYIAGITQAENQLNELNKNTDKNNDINNGSFLAKSNMSIPPIPPIPGQALAWFEGFENHTSFFGVFRNAAYYGLEGQHLQILRAGQDLYRDAAVMAGEKHFKESDIFTRTRYSQTMLDQFAKTGVKTITYKNGARYSIDSYCEMVGRTVAGRAAVQASLNRYVESGYNLVIVTSHFRACDLCVPYEGKILSIETHPYYESIDDAITQGLFHPRCGHSVTAYFEGLTEITLPSMAAGEQKLIDKFGYNEAQKISYAAQLRQRTIERNIRNYKRLENVALTDIDKQKAHRKVLEWQKKQREHLKENTFLPRKYKREQIRRAY
jgi:hypothetical protein